MSPVPFSLASSSSSNLKFRGIMIGAAMVVKNMLTCLPQRYDAFLQTTHKMIHNAFLIPRLNNLVEFNSFRIQLTLGLFRSKYESYIPISHSHSSLLCPSTLESSAENPGALCPEPGSGSRCPVCCCCAYACVLTVRCMLSMTQKIKIFSKNIKSLAYIRVSS